jgi:hypothetical protein
MFKHLFWTVFISVAEPEPERRYLRNASWFFMLSDSGKELNLSVFYTTEINEYGAQKAV